MEINIFYIAVGVFVLMVIGLALTVLEFRHGAPSQQVKHGLEPKHPGR